MSVIGNPLLLGGDAGAPSFTTDRSVRLRSSNSAYFSRTPASAGNRTTWTWSGWVKRGIINSAAVQYFLLGNNSANNDAGATFIYFYQDGLRITGFNTTWRQTTQVFRDPSAWYHIVIVWDTTNATALDRVRIYVNGVQVTTFSTTNNPTQNSTGGINAASLTYIGADTYLGPTNYFDGYLTEVNFIDGQALTPSSFGEYDSVRNTQWKPKAYTGTYGTNGFYLKFADNSNNTAATIGKDSSGNSNNWTPNGISVTAGVTYDSMTDVPTLTNESASNFCTFNPIDTGGGSVTLSAGNLNYSIASGAGSQVRGTMGTDLTSKWYFEYTAGSAASPSNPQIFGLSTTEGQITNNTTSLRKAVSAYSDGSTNRIILYYLNGTIISNYQIALTSVAIGDILQIAYDAATGKVWFGKNNSWLDASNGTTGNPSAGTNQTVTIATGDSMTPFLANLGATYSGSLNCGQRPFAFTPPTGFKSLNTYNLPDPAVASSDDYHKIYTYTGNGGGLQVGEVQKPASLFNLDRSLRFRSANSAYLSKTWGTPTNGQKFTCSFWLKRGLIGVAVQPFGGGTAAANAGGLQFLTSDALNFYWENATNCNLTTTNVYKDPSLWYHIVVVQDTTQATPANRVQIYVNGVLQTLSGTYPSQNATATFNAASVPFGIMAGRTTVYSLFVDGYLADVYWIDGQAPDATSFGAYDGNFYWTPKAYTGTYGTNGFHLEFEDFSNNTAATIGKDTSGNVNNWTPTGISVTAGVTNDSMTDVPTLTSADVANFCTLNPLAASTSTVPTQGNLYLGNNAVNNFACVATLGVSSGKWYWELKPDSNFVGVGVTPLSALPANTWTGASGSQAKAYYSSNGQKYDNGTGTAYGATWTSADLIGVALDMDAGTITFYKNGTSQGVAFTGLTGVYYPVIGGPNAYNSGYINFGQRPFSYTPPTNFKSLNSFNVAEVLGDVESPDFVWIKSRSASGDHALFNSVTGVGKYFRSNSASAEVTDVNSLIQFNKNGFLLGNSAIVNSSAVTFVAAAWKAGNTTVTNTAGTISSQVRSNTTSGISIVTWTGTGSNNPTIGHGLGKVPALIIAKNRDTSATDNNAWVYHQNIGTNYYILLTSPNLRATGALNGYIGTSPSDQTFTITAGSTSSNNLNEINDRFEAICFAEINGFSKFGSYLSNNDPNGPFVYTGFRPRWLMVKRAIAASGTGGWFMYDASRNTYNVMDQYMFAEGTAGDNALAVFDFTSNGFKIRSNNVHVNTTAGDTYIYMAFAEHPFKYALAR